MDCTELNVFDEEDVIEPCRACGIYFISSQGIILPIFAKLGAGNCANGNMPEIVQQMNEWNLGVNENDGRPQYMCITCIDAFRKVLQFKRSCLETQQQLDELEYKRAHNGIVIKKELQSNCEETFCGFIYLDTDEEESSEEDGSRRVCAPLDIPHVPIKEEHTARVPHESKYQPAVPVEMSLPAEATFSQVKPEDLATANGLCSTLFAETPGSNDGHDSEEEIIKFTYVDDGQDEALVTLPTPMQDPGVFCKLCGHASLSQAQHTEHMERIHMLKDCECHICGKKFSNAHASRLRFHMKWHKLQKHLKCPICGFFCNSKDTLKEHKLAVHTRAKCQFCGKQMKHKLLQAHLNRHIDEYEAELAFKLGANRQASQLPEPTPEPCLIQCAFCEHMFTDAEELQEHVLSTHRTSSVEQPLAQPVVLPVEEPMDQPMQELVHSKTEPAAVYLEMTANGEPARATEEDTSPDTAPAELGTCTSAVQGSSDSRLHSNSTEQTSSSMYKCHLCGKTFNLKIKLNRHLRLHTKAPF
ncbi:hypothetical protein KR222_005927 [Zaprionus bogoriensis]|nr:hypothetical protein KR222_005927 [Zaprionus bogoriensis]